MNRWIPVIAVLVVLLAIGVLTLPPLYRGMLFKRDCQVLVAAITAGNVAAITGSIDPLQQTAAGKLFSRVLPADFQTYIASMKMTHWERRNPAEIEAILTLRTEYNGGTGVFQGKLRFTYDAAARRWWWDINSTQAAEFTMSGEPQWQPLVQLLELAGRF